MRAFLDLIAIEGVVLLKDMLSEAEPFSCKGRECFLKTVEI